jgi:tight adherence protein B
MTATPETTNRRGRAALALVLPLLVIALAGSGQGAGAQEPDPARSDVIVDNASVQGGSLDVTQPDASDPLADEDGLPLWLMIATGVTTGAILLVGAGALALRHRRTLEVPKPIEEPLAPVDDEPVATGAPAYRGADDAGAYEAGGAAYAQHTAESTEPPPNPVAPRGAVTNGEPARMRGLAGMQSAVTEFAEKAAVAAGKDRTIAKKLEAAGSQMRAGEWLAAAAGASLATAVVVFLTIGWVLGLALGVFVAFGFWFQLGRKADKRSSRFAEQLPETLQLLAGSLRGGSSVIQGMQTVADEADSPTAEEFQRIITETRLGRDLGASFEDLAGRMGSQDFTWVVTAIEIHREVGGDLASILDRVGNTIRARNRVRGQVKALSAEGRVSGMILFILPPAMVGMIALLNRDYLDEMVTTSEGQIMLVVSAVLLLAGGAWLKRLSRFVY